ncbi:hypothetical protein ACCO45_005256 [Purpureocillium lilacinum]|uniref:Uncharacterized protein n=1 Tax=Purpureocillium lilacinum TaxID=33203 RepID=A0ACC4DV01_PURLI
MEAPARSPTTAGAHQWRSALAQEPESTPQKVSRAPPVSGATGMHSRRTTCVCGRPLRHESGFFTLVAIVQDPVKFSWFPVPGHQHTMHKRGFFSLLLWARWGASSSRWRRTRPGLLGGAKSIIGQRRFYPRLRRKVQPPTSPQICDRLGASRKPSRSGS